VSPNEFRVTIASPADRNDLVAEVFFGTDQVAELNQDAGTIDIEVYPRRSGEPWKFSCDEFVRAVNHARARLVGG
jgi:hypothetical protein